MTTLRELLETDRVAVGGWLHIPDAFSAELMGRAGWDWMCIDMQHGLIGYEQSTAMLQALVLTGTPAFVRVPWNQPDHIMKALDAGAQGIIVPMVNSAAEARQAVDAVKYPPVGQRSWGPIRAALGVEGYSPESANRRTVLAVMLETAEGVANIDEILSVPGVDVALVGPSDLALGHGMPPSLDPAPGSAHERLILTIVAACQRHGVAAAIFTDTVATAIRWRSAGYRLISLTTDTGLIRNGAAQMLATWREGAG